MKNVLITGFTGVFGYTDYAAAKFTYLIKRLLPGLVELITDSQVKSVQKTKQK